MVPNMLRIAHAYNLRAICSVALLVFVSACATQPVKQPPAKPQPPLAGAERLYASNLSLARMALIRNPDSLAEALPYINRLNAYALGPHATNVPFTIVQLYFTEKDTDVKYVAFSPVAPAGGSAGRFELLDQMMEALKPFKPVYYQVQIRTTSFGALTPISVWRTDATTARTEINRIYSTLNTNATILSRLENAALKLELTEFFIKHRARDAAYLSLESAKVQLAGASKKDAQSDEVKRLSNELTRVENILNKELPYKW